MLGMFTSNLNIALDYSSPLGSWKGIFGLLTRRNWWQSNAIMQHLQLLNWAHKFYGFGQIRYSVYDAEFGEFPFPVGFFSGAEEEQCDSRLQVCQLMR